MLSDSMGQSNILGGWATETLHTGRLSHRDLERQASLSSLEEENEEIQKEKVRRRNLYRAESILPTKLALGVK